PKGVNEREFRLLLCYRGQTRASFQIIERQTRAVERGDGTVLGAMHDLKACAAEMKQSLLRGRLDEFGDMLHGAWEAKKRLEPHMSAPRIDDLYAAARRAGALGGKMPGAGGGGFFFLLCRADRRHHVAQVVEKHGGKIVEFGFE